MTSTVKVDTISENTSANGVAVDGVTLKDGAVGAAGTATSVAGVPLYSADSSIYIGQDVSGTDDTAQYNVAIGFTTLDAITTGDSNVAIGYNAMTANTTGGSNISIGKSALGTNTTGSTNIAIGLDALLNPDTESNNLGIGNAALGGSIAGGEYNVAIGNTSLDALTSGDNNTAIGHAAFSSLTSSSENLAVGYQTGLLTTTGDYITFVGSNAGYNNTTGANNTALGRFAYGGADTESNNTAIGVNALSGSIAGGEFNVAIGNYTGDAITSGDHNTLVGYNTGSGLTTGGSNVLIGSSLSMADVTHSNAIIIGTGIAGNGDRFSFGKGSNVVQNTFTSDANWSRTSDERLKTNVNNVGWKSLDFINELRPVTFNWKASQDVPTDMAEYYPNVNHMDTTTVIDGLIAQEVKTAIDNNNMTNFSGWKTDPSGTQTLSKEAFVIPLIKAVQELSATVTTLQNEVNTLKGE